MAALVAPAFVFLLSQIIASTWPSLAAPSIASCNDGVGLTDTKGTRTVAYYRVAITEPCDDNSFSHANCLLIDRYIPHLHVRFATILTPLSGVATEIARYGRRQAHLWEDTLGFVVHLAIERMCSKRLG